MLKYSEQLLKWTDFRLINQRTYILSLKRVRYRHICLIDHKSTLGACQEQAKSFLRMQMTKSELMRTMRVKEVRAISRTNKHTSIIDFPLYLCLMS